MSERDATRVAKTSRKPRRVPRLGGDAVASARAETQPDARHVSSAAKNVSPEGLIQPSDGDAKTLHSPTNRFSPERTPTRPGKPGPFQLVDEPRA